jgi:hypothetical protein
MVAMSDSLRTAVESTVYSWAHQVIHDRETARAQAEAVIAQLSKSPLPIPMRLTCPGTNPDGTLCGRLHIDEGEFATKPHHTHSCQYCGMTWRPAVVPTVGVQFLPGFKNESPAQAIHIGDRVTIRELGISGKVVRLPGNGFIIVSDGRFEFGVKPDQLSFEG